MSILNIGDKAPAFKSKDQDGNIHSLTEYKGKKLVLYFYPKDDSPGCTAESCNLRDNYAGLKKKGFAIIGVSADDEKSHKKFAEKFDLPFPILADTEKKMLEAYNAWGEKSMYGKKYMGIIRKTYVIDEKGKIEKIFEKVDTKNHTEQILESYK
jgi:peroxiredoxin Q/BCP